MNCYNSGEIFASYSGNSSTHGVRVGGIVGSNYAGVINCYNVGVLSNSTSTKELFVGEIVGQNNTANGHTGFVRTCYAKDGSQIVGANSDHVARDTWTSCGFFSGADDNSIVVYADTALTRTSSYDSLQEALNDYDDENSSLREWAQNSYINSGYPTYGTSASSAGSAGATSGYLINGGLMYVRGSGVVTKTDWEEADKSAVHNILFSEQITYVADDVFSGFSSKHVDVVCNNPNCLILNVPGTFKFMTGIKVSGSAGSYTAKNIQLTDGFPLVTPPGGFTAQSVTYTGRTFPAEDGYGTLILPFAPNTTYGLTFYTLGTVSNNSISFTVDQTPAANTPYLFKTGSGTVSVTGTGTGTGVPVETSADGTTISDWTMKGAYTTTTLQNVPGDTTRYYFDADASLIRPLSDGYTLTVNPFRCYFDVLSASNARAFEARFGDEDATSIESLIEKTPLVIFGERGAISLKCNAAMPVEVYSVNGAQVAKEQLSAGEEKSLSLPAGIYLVNGNKVLVK